MVSRIFSVEGKFYSVTSKMADMVVITLLWLVGCIPIITILTSTSSMYHTTVKCVRYERGKAFEEFKEAYKKNLKPGISLTIFYGMIGVAVGFADYRVFGLMQGRTAGGFIMAVVLLVVTALYLMNVLGLIPVFSRFSNTFGKTIQLNYVIAARNIIRSLPMFLVIIAAVILVLASFPLVIIFPSLAMFLISYLSEPGLHKYMPKQEEDNGDWRYGFR